MSGKRDQTSQDAAIEKLNEALPYADIIRTHLAELLTDPVFKGSRRSQEFLTHVVECALTSQWSRLKERSLGVEVFGRDPSYNTGGDAIVRVTASEVRKRLLQYYSEREGKGGIRIEIPAGSYVPVFTGLEELATAVVPSSAVDVEANNNSTVVSAAPHPLVRHRNAALALLFIAVGWGVGLLTAHFLFSSSASADARYGFYRRLLGPIATDPEKDTEIALSNPTPDDQAYDGTGEAVAAFNLGQLMRDLGRSPRLTESLFLNRGALTKDHLILLGATLMSTWSQERLERANFTMERDAITNALPLPGEQPSYALSVRGNVLEGYGLIWMYQSPSGGSQLLIAGLTGAGTAGASDFFCNPDRMRPVYERLRSFSKDGSIPSNWQILLHIHARDDVPLRINVVALRVGKVRS